jgi:class 3 adenylate cyclase
LRLTVKQFKGILIVGVFTYLTLFLNHGVNAAQGIPTMMNYHHSEYRAETQNWSVVQNSNGLIYIANLSGILEFDGNSWRLIPLPGNKYVTSLGIDENDVIYAGSHSEFGILKPDAKGFLHYHSLLDLFPDNHKEFSFIWQIEPTSEGIFFSNYDNLFRLKDDTVTSWEFSRFSNFFSINNQILVYDIGENKGLMYLKDDSLTRFNDSDALSDLRISGIYPFDENRLLVYSREKGFFTINDIASNPLLNFNPVSLAQQEAFSYLKKNQFTIGRPLKNGNYAFATLKAGVIVMDKSGAIISVINEDLGLQNETVNFIFEDRDNILWLALDNGLSSVNLNLGIRYWSSKHGLKGSVLSINRLNETVYAGTWQGLYKLKTKNQSEIISANETLDFSGHFESIEQIRGITWQLNPVTYAGETIALLVSTSEGLFCVDNKNKIKQLEEGHFYYSLQSETDPRLILAAGGQGLNVYKMNPSCNTLELLTSFPDFKHYEIYRITEDENLKFWLTHRRDGVSYVEILKTRDSHGNSHSQGESGYSFHIEHFNPDHGLPSATALEAFKFGNSVYFISDDGIFQFVSESQIGKSYFNRNNFFTDHLLRNYVSVRFIKAVNDATIMAQVHKKHNRNKKVVKISFDKGQKEFTINNNSYNFLAGLTISDIYFDKINNESWIAADDIIYKYTNEKIAEDLNLTCFIRKVDVNKREIWGGNSYAAQSDLSQNRDFPHIKNNFNFRFAATDFVFPTHTVYSSKLRGLENEWSQWSEQSSRLFTNLPPGSYTFMVKARNAFGNESNVETFSFRIRKPWYTTITAIISYIALLAVLVWSIVRMVHKQLFYIKRKLEEKIQERTREIEEKNIQLKEEKKKSDQLLQNILPEKIAQELKANGTVRVQYYDLATIMFLDFKDFSKISQFISPLTLINELDNSFTKFDEIAKRNRLEKIKTIGDAYMCAGGLPEQNETNPFDAILAALEILSFVGIAEENQWLSEVRIGIHTGEILAGVIGKNKFAYDIWGEAVNIANRMETASESGRINISGETYELVKDYFDCDYRGKLEVKHRNQFDMYYVLRIKKEFSKDEEGMFPNDLFWYKVNAQLNLAEV